MHSLSEFMNRYFKTLLISAFCCLTFSLSFAWGPEGHAIVGRIAMQYVKPDVRKNILQLLGNMSVDTAANWMDIMKSNHDYDFMRSWHYADVARGEEYKETAKDNLLNRLQLTYNELQHKKILCTSQVRMDMLVLMHLVGDLTMPLHTGYEDDLGGNKVMVQYDTLKTHNLHWFWDEDIIRLTNITETDCIAWYDALKENETEPVNFYEWMMDSHSLLDSVYDYKGFLLTDEYMNKNKILVEKQLMKAGLRLANVLNSLFQSPADVLDYTKIAKKKKNGISLSQATLMKGKKVAVCGRVTNVKVTAKTTQLIITDENNANEMAVVIFTRDYNKYPDSPGKIYKNANICISGKVNIFNGKPEIVIEEPTDISIIEEGN